MGNSKIRFGFIYKITNIITGDFYIGKTISKNPIFRLNAHISNALRRNKHNNKFYNAIEKYGSLCFIFNVIYECDELNLDRAEIYYIKKLSPKYNTSAGGTSTKGFLGKTLSEAHKKALCASGKVPVYQYDLDGNFIRSFGYIKEVETVYSSSKTISHCLRGKQKSAIGFQWFREYKGLKVEPYIKSDNGRNRAIQQIDENGKVINEWSCMSQACRDLLVSTSKVTLVCQGKRNSTKGFKFKYK